MLPRDHRFSILSLREVIHRETGKEVKVDSNMLQGRRIVVGV